MSNLQNGFEKGYPLCEKGKGGRLYVSIWGREAEGFLFLNCLEVRTEVIV